jgi:hypothetical protein
MTTAEYKTLKVSPRGFANEVIYLRVPMDKVAEAEAEYANYSDGDGYAEWTTDTKVDIPGVAVQWEDRDRL